MKYLFTIICLFCLLTVQSQNLEFSIVKTVDNTNGVNDAQVEIYVESAGADETLVGFTSVIYYNSAETSNAGISSLTINPALGWNTAGSETLTNTAETNAGVGIVHDTRLELQFFDNNATGSSVSSTPLLLATVTFINDPGSPAVGSDLFLSDATLSPGIEYIDGTFAGQPINTTVSNQLSLPIELSKFNVTKRDERSADLVWTTSSEQNGSHFEIERSYDGLNFDYIGTVEAIGESKEVVNYDFLDRTIELVANQSTMVYYKLRMVDNDGSYEYSDVKNVVFGTENVEVTVHPNPTADYIQLNTTVEITGVSIFNVNGKVITDNAPYDGQVDLTSLNSGMYKIMVHTSNGNFLKSIVKID